MFAIELNTLASKASLKTAVSEQRKNLAALTHFEGQVFVMFCMAVGGDQLADKVARELLRLPKRSSESYNADEITTTMGTLQNDAGGGSRVIRSSRGLT